jgi:hypothetical protein
MAQHALRTNYNKPWDLLPAEIRLMILEILMQDGCSLASFATVSREWQTVIERRNFTRIKLTPQRLVQFGSMMHRNRALLSYIWLSLELQEYDCTECAPQEPELWGVSYTDNALITTTLQDLFSTLSAWEPIGELMLDISVYSPSDSKHWFKYLTFGPDTPSDKRSEGQFMDKLMLIKDDDNQHGWTNGRRDTLPTSHAIQKVFEEIMGEGPFDSDEQEVLWWQQLPSVPAITGILLRQQNRRRWRPAALAHMFSRLPRLQEICYEPWREWDKFDQTLTDKGMSYQGS